MTENELKMIKCENCGNEGVEIINTYKGHYICGGCGRDTEELYMIEHDAEIREKAIDEFVEKVKGVYHFTILELEELDEIAEQMKGR